MPDNGLLSAQVKCSLEAGVVEAPLYELSDVRQIYTTGGEELVVLRGVTVSILPGETVAVVGASGTGKSSLLHILGTLASPTSGTVYFEGKDVSKLNLHAWAELRNRSIGFVFQFHHMLPEFSTCENVAMPAIIAGIPKQEAFEMARDLLHQVGLEKRENYNITLLSGGERQRAAIARALVMSPRVLLADEPTGNLDEDTGRNIIDLLLELNERHKMAMVMVTHNLEFASRMGRCFEIKSGDIYEQTR